uniref:Cytochrome b5-like protein n=1 Tax=Acartia pacifica TaxID=335913 RepID=R9TIN2_ACAPC|nr:cytochrome b5-like protein [Acartia pacifica]
MTGASTMTTTVMQNQQQLRRGVRLQAALASVQSMLAVYTVLSLSRAVTVTSLRLLARILHQLADRLDTTTAAAAAATSQLGNIEDVSTASATATAETSTAAAAAATTASSHSRELDDKYNQLLVQTQHHLLAMAKQVQHDNDLKLMLPTSSENNHHQRTRTDTVDSGADDLDDIYADIDPDTGLEIVSLAEVGQHCTYDDAWMVIYDKVYDVTDYMVLHPGGEEVMLEYAGYDATIALRGVAHSRAAFRALDRYCVGILPADERLNYAAL